MTALKPYYPYPPIWDIESLANTLSINKTLLLDIASKVDQSYTAFEVKSKNNKIRIVHEPKFYLKKIQKRINSRIFENVEYPFYLQGGIKDPKSPRDYVNNASRHCGQHAIINLDIKNFYPNIKAEYVYDIYLRLFNFSSDVSKVLTSLTTYKGRVPQGACTSSYIANLVFFNSEYTLASQLSSRGYQYSRLLDDITISSNKPFTEEEKTDLIRKANSLFKKYGLQQNNKKRKIEIKANPESSFTVTGVWVGKDTPKIRKRERRFIRQLVYLCEQKYNTEACSDDYHKLWNKVSGKVAKLTRLNHKQSKLLRERLSKVLPIFDENAKRNLIIQVKNIQKIKGHQANRPGHVAKVNQLLFQLGILSRTDKLLAKSLRKSLAGMKLPTKKELWENDDY